MTSLVSRLHAWLNNVPIQDPVNRRMGTMLQIILIGFIASLVIAAGINLVIAEELTWQVILIRNAIAILIVVFPLLLLRRGHFHVSALVIIAIFLLIEFIALASASLRDVAETLAFLTLAIILAGLLVGPRALVITFLLSAGMAGFNAFQELRVGLGMDGFVVAGNFILLNGLMSLFLIRFGVVLRDALASALAREKDLLAEIVERQRATEALQESERKNRALFDQAHDAIFVLDLQGRNLDANQRAANLLGYTREELVGLSFREISAEIPQSEQILDGLLHGEHIPLFERIFRRKSGERIPVEINVELIRDAHGSPSYIQSVVRDITERKMTEQELRESEDRFRSLSEAAFEGIMIHDQGIIINANLAFAQLFGFQDPKELIDRNGLEILPLSEKSRQALKASIGMHSTGVAEIEAIGPDGSTFPAETQGRDIIINGRTLRVVAMRDITARKRVEAEREKLIAELTAKNTELEHFIYTVSHDLKSPLVTIKGYLGYLEQDAAAHNIDRLRMDTQRISNAVDKMQELLGELLEISRIGRFINPPVAVPFAELVNEALELVQGRIQEKGATIDIQPDLPVVFVDKPRLLEVLENLIDNAVKYMGNQPEPRVEIGACGEKDGMPLFYVRDNGIGIAPEHYERVFGLFNKLDSTSEGTGVGLALVRRIIEYHGGRIWIESKPGKGATFCFTLRGAPESD